MTVHWMGVDCILLNPLANTKIFYFKQDVEASLIIVFSANRGVSNIDDAFLLFYSKVTPQIG